MWLTDQLSNWLCIRSNWLNNCLTDCESGVWLWIGCDWLISCLTDCRHRSGVDGDVHRSPWPDLLLGADQQPAILRTTQPGVDFCLWLLREYTCLAFSVLVFSIILEGHNESNLNATRILIFSHFGTAWEGCLQSWCSIQVMCITDSGNFTLRLACDCVSMVKPASLLKKYVQTWLGY